MTFQRTKPGAFRRSAPTLKAPPGVKPRGETVSTGWVGAKPVTVYPKPETPTTSPVSKKGTLTATPAPAGPAPADDQRRLAAIRAGAPKLTGRANALTRGRGLKLGLRRLAGSKRPSRMRFPRPPKA